MPLRDMHAHHRGVAVASFEPANVYEHGLLARVRELLAGRRSAEPWVHLIAMHGRFWSPSPSPRLFAQDEAARNSYHAIIEMMAGWSSAERGAKDAAGGEADGLYYAEGLVRLPGEAVRIERHVWSVTEDGCALDTSLAGALAYFGIPFLRPWVLDTTSKAKRYGILNNPSISAMVVEASQDVPECRYHRADGIVASRVRETPRPVYRSLKT